MSCPTWDYQETVLAASNHSIFYPHGVPSIALCFRGDVPNVIHQPTDTIDWISPARLAEAASLVVGVVFALQDRTSDWCRRTEVGSMRRG